MTWPRTSSSQNSPDETSSGAGASVPAHRRITHRVARRMVSTAETVIGWTLVIVGIPLMPLPGPGTLVIVAGVALLARRYNWARRVLRPLGQHAVEAARYGVATRLRIAWSCFGVVWVIGLAVLWWINPVIGSREILGVTIGPRLPLGGRATGIGLLVSALAAGALLAYSIVRWRGDDPQSHDYSS